MAKYTITFEVSAAVDGTPKTFGRAKTLGGSLHEALCQAIHEGNNSALYWLQTEVQDIILVSGDKE